MVWSVTNADDLANGAMPRYTMWIPKFYKTDINNLNYVAVLRRLVPIPTGRLEGNKTFKWSLVKGSGEKNNAFSCD